MKMLYIQYGKRAIDCIAASCALIILSPVIAVLALIVYFRLGSPVQFRQIRPGLNQKPFEIIKFRTMLELQGEDGYKLSDSERLTSFGRFLRATSMDELPELWNVLRGEMSFVGPRPLLMEYLPLYTAKQARRHEVRPGITGWAQVNGRNAISWEDKFKLDVWYVENCSFSLDLKIIYVTILRVLQRDGINAGEGVTMPRFVGSPDRE